MKLSCMMVIVILFSSFQRISAQTFDQIMQKAEMASNNMETQKAIKLYTKAIKLNGKSAEAYYFRGLTKTNVNFNDGTEDFLKSIEINPNYEPPYHQLSFAYSMNGDDEKSEMYALKGISLNPSSPNNLLLRAQILRKSGNLKTALIFCDSSINQHDESVEWLAMAERAEIKFEMADYTGAVADFSTCFNEFAFGMYSTKQFEMCGDAYFNLGNMNRACQYWSVALEDQIQQPSEEVKTKLINYCK